jgi:hypothetical protein
MRPSFWIRSLRGILNEKPVRPWTVNVLLETETNGLARFHAHLSILQPGAATNEPCGHIDEELAIVLDGELGVLGPSEQGPNLRATRIPKDRCAFHESWDVHDYQNFSDKSVTYLVLRWKARMPLRDVSTGRGETVFGVDFEKGRPMLDLNTDHLRRLRVSDLFRLEDWNLQPSGGSDRIIHIAQGEISLSGIPVRGPALVAVPAGMPLSARCEGSSPPLGKMIDLWSSPDA